MKSSFADFIKEMPVYQKFDGNRDAIYIFENILSRDENIIGMIDANEAGKPALSGCIQEVEAYYLSQATPTFDLTDNFTKTALGAMVKVILDPFGYQSKSQKSIPKSCNPRFVGSAMTYEKTGQPTMKVERAIVEI